MSSFEFWPSVSGSTDETAVFISSLTIAPKSWKRELWTLIKNIFYQISIKMPLRKVTKRCVLAVISKESFYKNTFSIFNHLLKIREQYFVSPWKMFFFAGSQSLAILWDPLITKKNTRAFKITLIMAPLTVTEDLI